MTGWQIPGIPPVPGMSELMRLMQLQAEVLSQLPENIAELSSAARGLAEAVEATKETAASASRVVRRLESLLDELEDPVHGLRPGVERVAEILDAPVVQRIPEVLESIEAAVLPLSQGVEQTRLRIEAFARARRTLLTHISRAAQRVSPDALNDDRAAGSPPRHAAPPD